MLTLFDLSKLAEESWLTSKLEQMVVELKAKFEFLSGTCKVQVASDRHDWIESRAGEAHSVSENNDVRGCFAIVRSLAGAEGAEPLKTIRKLKFERAIDENETK